MAIRWKRRRCGLRWVVWTLTAASLGGWTASPATVASLLASASAKAADAEPLIPVKPEVLAARQKAISEKAPKGAKLVAYLDCGSQRESQEGGPVKIRSLGGKPYQFPEEAKTLSPTGSTIFFDTAELQFEIAGLDPARRYVGAISWWDFDNSGRTESILVGSPDGRHVRLAVPGIRLPDHQFSKQPPVDRKFPLPTSFAQEGKLRVRVQLHSGANCVAGEIWVWQID
jgi:hypothetical protein